MRMLVGKWFQLSTGTVAQLHLQASLNRAVSRWLETSLKILCWHVWWMKLVIKFTEDIFSVGS